MFDQDTITQQLARLAIHRRTLEHLIEQAAQFGGEVFAPPQTANGIAEARQQIRLIKANLRKSGVQVEDDPNDKATRRRKSARPQQPRDVVSSDKDGGGKVIGDKRSVTTGGGDYSDGGIDKRQGLFISGSTVNGPTIGVVQGTVNFVSPEQIYNVSGACPFLGLSPFTYRHANIYAGCKHEIAKALKFLTMSGNLHSILFVTGASGSGKSSFVQAGLVPELEDYYHQRHLNLRVAEPFRPSSQPMTMLNNALQQLGGQDLSLLDGVKLIVIDQFEELFIQSDPIQKEHFLDLLMHLPSFDETQTHIIITLRSDFLGEIFQLKPLWDLAKQGIEIRGLSENELYDTIQKPLQILYPQNSFEPELLERLVKDASGDPALLPLLQVTLVDIWNKGSLTLNKYNNLTAAIQNRAELVYLYVDHDNTNPYKKRNVTEQSEMLDIFLDLINVSPQNDDRRDVRQRRSRVNLEKGSELRHKLIEDLINARLLATSKEGIEDNFEDMVDIIHETLIGNWKRLRLAVNDKRQQLQYRSRFEMLVMLWLDNGRIDDYLLLTKTQIAEARALEEKADIALRTSNGYEFYQRSIKHLQDAEQRQLIQVRKQAEQERKRAEELSIAVAETKRVASRARAGELAAQSQNALNRDPSLSLILAIEALNATQRQGDRRTPVAEEALRDAIDRFITSIHHKEVNNDGQLNFPDIRPIELTNGMGADYSFQLPRQGGSKVITSPNKHWEISWSGWGGRNRTTDVLKVFEQEAQNKKQSVWTRESIWHHELQNNPLQKLQVSLDSHWLITVQVQLSNHIWSLLLFNLDDKNPPGSMSVLRGHGSEIKGELFSPDNKWLITWDIENNMRVWDLESIEPSASSVTIHPYLNESIESILFSQDSHWLLLCYKTVFRLWNLRFTELLEQAGEFAGRNFTYREWREYFPGETYRKTFTQWPLDEEPGEEYIPGDA